MKVHHINGEGEDGGVVYSEMKNRASGSFYKIDLEALHHLFPGKCGYKWDTGGALENLRNSTNNHKIRDYHKQYYRPENMVIIIAGQVEKQKLFDAIQVIEEEEKKKVRGPFVKPFGEPCPLSQEKKDLTLEYPQGD